MALPMAGLWGGAKLLGGKIAGMAMHPLGQMGLYMGLPMAMSAFQGSGQPEPQPQSFDPRIGTSFAPSLSDEYEARYNSIRQDQARFNQSIRGLM